MEKTFDIDLLLRESKNTLLNPKKYFSELKNSGGLLEPLLKALAYGTISGLIYLICWMFRIKAFGAGNIGDAVGFLAFIKIVIVSGLGLYIGAGFILVISSVCKGKSDFESNVRVASSLMVLLPVFSIVSISSSLSVNLGFALNLIFFAYLLWISYYGFVETLKCKPQNSRIACYVLLLVIVLMLVINQISLKKSENLNDKDVKKSQKVLKKN
jgi:hypothetical protein